MLGAFLAQQKDKMKPCGRENSIRAAETAAARLLSDGTAVEIIRDPQDPSRLNFLSWHNGVADVVKHVARDGRIVLPPTFTADKIETLAMPTGAHLGGSAGDLFNDIAAAISGYVDLNDNALSLVTSFVLYTWLQDRFPEATYLWLVGPLGSGKTVLLRVLGCLCRRALLIGDSTLASIYRLANQLGPTIALDEADFRRSDAALLRFLRASSSLDFPAIRNGQAYRTFGAKILASRQPPPDAALRSRAVFIPTLPTDREVLRFDSEQASNLKARFQNRLLGFRLQTDVRVMNHQLSDVQAFTPRMRGIAQTLTYGIRAEAALVAHVVEVLREQNDTAKMDRAIEPESLVVEALFASIHEAPIHVLQKQCQTIITIGGVAQDVNTMLDRWGAGVTYSARALGPVLRSLGIQTRKLGNWGYGMRLNTSFRRQVHALAKQLCITRRDISNQTAIEYGAAGRTCTLCDEFDVKGGLRCSDPFVSRSKSTGNVRRGTRGKLFSRPDRTMVGPAPLGSDAIDISQPEPVNEQETCR